VLFIVPSFIDSVGSLTELDVRHFAYTLRALLVNLILLVFLELYITLQLQIAVLESCAALSYHL